MVTDPPYGVSYDPAWRERAGLPKAARSPRGKVLNDDRADWREAWALFPGDVAYVWHGAFTPRTVATSLEACRLRRPLPDHLGQDPTGDRPRRLSLAARAGLVRGPQRARPAIGRATASRPRSGPSRTGSRETRPRHREAGRMHAAADREQLLAGPGGLRAILADPAPRSSPPR